MLNQVELRIRGGIRLIGVDGQAFKLRNCMALCRYGTSGKSLYNGRRRLPRFRDRLGRTVTVDFQGVHLLSLVILSAA